ncbi:MAG: DNA-processing protein DprA [Candidatus Dormibacteria bacterium]
MSTAAAELPAGWWACPSTSADYPTLLTTIHEPPDLAVRGEIHAGAEMVAIVGARRSSAYGEEVAYEIARHLASVGLTIVSGMARGIDAAAHRGAIDAGGRTVAVMGTGPDSVYPPEHRGLADRIASSGALLTQFPVGMVPRKGNFPTRNAVISGMSLAVVVVEARRQSGAMLTAGAAGNQGRMVMAVPGSVHNAASRGCHDLIRDGAQLVASAQDILADLRGEPMLRLLDQPAEVEARFGDVRDRVLAALRAGCLTLDELVAAVSGPSAEVVTAVARLRLEQEIRLRDGAYGLAVERTVRNRAAPNRVV